MASLANCKPLPLNPASRTRAPRPRRANQKQPPKKPSSLYSCFQHWLKFRADGFSMDVQCKLGAGIPKQKTWNCPDQILPSPKTMKLRMSRTTCFRYSISSFLSDPQEFMHTQWRQTCRNSMTARKVEETTPKHSTSLQHCPLPLLSVVYCWGDQTHAGDVGWSLILCLLVF